MNNYYDILGVPQDASVPQIKSAYRQLAKANSIDLLIGQLNKYKSLGDKDLEQTIQDQINYKTQAMKLINKAYYILLDPQKRDQYDQQLKNHEEGLSYEQATTVPLIVLDPPSLNFGYVEAGDSASLSFQILNTGGHANEVNIDWESTPNWASFTFEPSSGTSPFPIIVTIWLNTNRHMNEEVLQADLEVCVNKVIYKLPIKANLLPHPTDPVPAPRSAMPTTPPISTPVTPGFTSRFKSSLKISTIIVLVVFAIMILITIFCNLVFSMSKSVNEASKETRTTDVLTKPKPSFQRINSNVPLKCVYPDDSRIDQTEGCLYSLYQITNNYQFQTISVNAVDSLSPPCLYADTLKPLGDASWKSTDILPNRTLDIYCVTKFRQADGSYVYLSSGSIGPSQPCVEVDYAKDTSSSSYETLKFCSSALFENDVTFTRTNEELIVGPDNVFSGSWSVKYERYILKNNTTNSLKVAVEDNQNCKLFTVANPKENNHKDVGPGESLVIFCAEFRETYVDWAPVTSCVNITNMNAQLCTQNHD